MTSADMIVLRVALQGANHSSRANQSEAKRQFRYLNEKYTRPVVDEAIRALGKEKA